MAQLTLKPVWTDKLTIIEKNDPVEGGVDGIDNKPHIEMANNIAYVKKMVEDSDETIEELKESIEDTDQTVKDFAGAIEDDDGEVTLKSLLNRIKELEDNTNKIPIGGLFQTTKHYQSDGDVAQVLGYGIWQRALQGRVAVGFSSITTDPVEYRTHSSEYGTFEHTLIIDEMPSHSHDWKFGREKDDNTEGGSHDEFTYKPTDDDINSDEPIAAVGGDKAHPNQPPSKTIDVWERIS